MGLRAARTESGPPDVAGASVSFWIGRVYYNYVGLLERTLAARGLDSHVRPGMGHILFALFERDGCIIRDIKERTQLSPSTLTAMLGRMERAGLLTLGRDGSDGRAVRVKLTPLGRSLESRCRAVAEDLEAMLGEGMSESERRALIRSLEKLVANIRKYAGNGVAGAAKSRKGRAI